MLHENSDIQRPDARLGSQKSNPELGHDCTAQGQDGSGPEGTPFAELLSAFERLFHHPATRPLDRAWVEAYRARRPVAPLLRVAAPVDIAIEIEPPPTPNPIQTEALAKLEETRQQGHTAGLVVLATGLGKTWLAAFDSNRPEFRRILFVAHREEILGQALRTFRRIRPGARLGHYTGQDKDPTADVLFASIQTLGRSHHLERFAKYEFDYLVVDEFHHAAARSYRKLIDHFRPKFMLGLTATPERTDGGDLLALCQENLVYRCDLLEGLRRDQLCRFQYYGVPDEVDYSNIPWRNGGSTRRRSPPGSPWTRERRTPSSSSTRVAAAGSPIAYGYL